MCEQKHCGHDSLNWVVWTDEEVVHHRHKSEQFSIKASAASKVNGGKHLLHIRHKQSLKNTLLVFRPSELPSHFFLPRLWWNPNRRRTGQEKNDGKTCKKFFPPLRSSGFFSSNYTQVLPDASHCQRNSYLHWGCLSLRQEKGNALPFFVFILYQYSLEISSWIFVTLTLGWGGSVRA